MTDYDDYENNLAFEPVGDWADKGEVPTTDRTQSMTALIDKYAEVVEENKCLKRLLTMYWKGQEEYDLDEENDDDL